jgi:hypothetical protein
MTIAAGPVGSSRVTASFDDQGAPVPSRAERSRPRRGRRSAGSRAGGPAAYAPLGPIGACRACRAHGRRRTGSSAPHRRGCSLPPSVTDHGPAPRRLRAGQRARRHPITPRSSASSRPCASRPGWLWGTQGPSHPGRAGRRLSASGCPSPPALQPTSRDDWSHQPRAANGKNRSTPKDLAEAADREAEDPRTWARRHRLPVPGRSSTEER